MLKRRAAERRSRLELCRNGKQTHGYLLKPAPRRIDEFQRVMEDSFTRAAAPGGER